MSALVEESFEIPQEVSSLSRTPAVPEALEEHTSSHGEPVCACFCIQVSLSVGTVIFRNELLLAFKTMIYT